MADIQKQHNEWTYDQMAAEWRRWWSRQNNGREDGPTPSHYTINKALEMFGWSTKSLEWVAVAQNDEQHTNWREEYCKEAINWDRGNLIFVDETGFNAHMHRRRGRNEIGKRAQAVERNSAGYRINVCAAVSPVQGLVKYKAILTNYNMEEFASFMQELLDTPLLQSRSCIICMDNVSWHHRDEVHDVLRAGRVEHRIKRIRHTRHSSTQSSTPSPSGRTPSSESTRRPPQSASKDRSTTQPRSSPIDSSPAASTTCTATMSTASSGCHSINSTQG